MEASYSYIPESKTAVTLYFCELGTLPNGVKTKLPGLPLRIGSYEFGLRADTPHLGEGSREVLKSIDLGDQEIERLVESGVLGPVQE